MAQMIKAAVLTAPGHMELREFPLPTPQKGAAVAKVLSAGICGTDKHTYRGETKQYAGTRSEADVAFPLIQGHENVLEIVDIDKEGSEHLEFYGHKLKPGDRVTMCPDVTCGTCFYCTHFPVFPWCDSLQFGYGNSRSCAEAPHLFGGFAEYIYIVPGTRLYKVPDALPDDIASLTELMCVAYSLDKAKEFYSFSGEGFSFNDTVVVQGVGPLGLAHIIKARMLGAGKIIATDLSDYKLELARAFGADYTLNVNKTTAEERLDFVHEHTHGLGADLVVECVGRPHVVSEGISMLRKAGMYLETGNFVDCGPAEVSINEICTKNIRVIGMSNNAYTGYRPSMEMMVRTLDQFPWERFISHRFPLEQAEEAIRTSMSPDSMKVIIKP